MRHPTALLAVCLLLGVTSAADTPPPMRIPFERLQSAEAAKAESEFKRLAARLAEQRLGGAEESEKLQEQALAILDVEVFQKLNAAAASSLEALNERLETFATQQPPVGESYRVVSLEGRPPVRALVANFGLGGPSAVRLYTFVPGSSRYELAGRIDRFTQKDFFDENLELVPIHSLEAGRVIAFVTVAGRTDDLQTGVFTAWRFDGERVQSLWSTDVVQQSNYEPRPDGLQLTYCAQTDDDNPRTCRRMTRERYRWDGAVWKRAEQTSPPVPKR